MIKFEKIKAGMMLYDARKSTTCVGKKWDVWPVLIYQVDDEKRRVFASWNGNAATWIYERTVTKYRVKRPKEAIK